MSEKIDKAAQKAREHKYSIEELLLNSKAITGHRTEIAEGALFNCEEKELTKEEFKTKIEEFLKREVK